LLYTLCFVFMFLLYSIRPHSQTGIFSWTDQWCSKYQYLATTKPIASLLYFKNYGLDKLVFTDRCSLEHESMVNVQKIPGCSIVPIRVLKSSNSVLPKQMISELSENENVSDTSSKDHLVRGDCSKSIIPSHPLFHAILSLSGIHTHQSHVEPKKRDSLGRKYPKLVNDRLDWWTYQPKVQQIIGSTFDPFYNMPKFKGARANTSQYYYHCMEIKFAWAFS